ncbi:histone H1-like [Stegostoma tigrinum]|uniref:histone H1-like n=1 Tax=Stegostoma tigrinum TaxID=3053191 RepID=UPI00286FD420|nr:histone H1-like [Stegostoma tigrinum]XP_059498042.1 histone H1-like [Stegostoma tigrinum]
MSDSAAAETAPPASASTKPKAPKKKKAAAPRKKPAGPGLGERIVKIVGENSDRKGTSLAAIKKALQRSGVNVEKQNAQIRMATKRCLAKGSLVLVKGQGVSGSFKLPKNQVKAKVGKKARPAAAAKNAAVKKTTAKKVAAKKSPAKKATGKKAAGKKAATPKKAAKKAAPQKKTPVKKVKKTKSPKAAKPDPKSAKYLKKPVDAIFPRYKAECVQLLPTNSRHVPVIRMENIFPIVRAD